MSNTKTVDLGIARAMDCIKMCKLIVKSRYPFTELRHEALDSNIVDWVGEVIARGYAVNATVGGRLVATMGFSLNRYPWNRIKTYYQQEWICMLPNYGGIGIEQKMMDKIMRVAHRNRADVYANSPVIGDAPVINDFVAQGVIYRNFYGDGNVDQRGSGNPSGEADGRDGAHESGANLAQGIPHTVPAH